MNGRPQPPSEVPGVSVALVATVAYGLMFFAAVLWLHWGARPGRLAELAVGERGVVAATASGAALGLTAAGLLAVAGRYLAPIRELEKNIREAMGELTEAEIVAIAVVSAVGEETFFRGALQEWVGPYWAAAVFGLLHTGSGMRIWTVIAGALGLAFGLLVDAGLGLLSAAVAHALINYLSLRRMNAP
ncbi:MAG: CPBP family intramembrane metalloprotease [Planctomycetes bacterium]|nr:CPBP family intramembrane metalloprotease [Planctomycetota bacterium]MCB9888194.1 CPBP family intramembrane metalloprotease [Planctomycetota bacterium]